MLSSELLPNNGILQWNCRSLRKRRYTLKNIVNVAKPFAVVLQETFLANDSELAELKDLFLDFNFYFNNRPRISYANPRGGVAIMVLKDVPQTKVNLTTHLEAIAVNVIHRKKHFSIASLYLPERKVISVPTLTAMASQLLKDHLILGDFNSKSTLWGSPINNYRGNKVQEFIQNTDHVILNTGEPTYISSNGNFSHIDVSLATPQLSVDINWSTYTDTLGSDHIPIILKIGRINNNNDTYLPLCKYRTKKVDWEPYTALAKISLEGDNADKKLQALKSSILQASEGALPKIKNIRHRILVPWWSPECHEAIRKRNAAYRSFQRSPTDENYIEYKKFRALARKIIKEAKRKSWHDFVSKINKFTPTSEIWKHIRKINGNSYSRPLYLIVEGNLIEDPEVIAEELAKYFASVSSDDNLSDAFKKRRREKETNLDFNTNCDFNYNRLFLWMIICMYWEKYMDH